MGACLKCYRNKAIPFARCIVSCFGCKRCCFRPRNQDLIHEFCELASINDHRALNALAGRVRMLKGLDFKIGTLCCLVPEENVKNSTNKMNALHHAALGDHLETLLVILKLPGCDPNVRSSPCNYTSLHLAAKEGYVAMTHLLIKYKSDIDARDWKKNTALVHAASNGHSTCVKALVDNGCNLNFRNQNGFTALIASIINARRDASLMLIKLGASLDIADTHGNTPLHLAILRGDRHVVQFLLQCGAKVFSFNKFQASSLDEARRSKSKQILKIVEAAWAKHRGDLGLSPGLGPGGTCSSEDGRPTRKRILEEVDEENVEKPPLPLLVG